VTAEDDVDDFIEQFTLGQGELLKATLNPAKNLCSHQSNVTLANPLGPVVRGWEQVAVATDYAASQFRDGEIVDVEAAAKCLTPQLAYIVRVERSEAKVGGQQALTHISLRVTMIMRPKTAFGRSSTGTQTRSRRSASRINHSSVARQEITRFRSVHPQNGLVRARVCAHAYVLGLAYRKKILGTGSASGWFHCAEPTKP
jgi:hypothetical protein